MKTNTIIVTARELRDIEGNPEKALKELLRYKADDFKEYGNQIEFLILKAVLYRDTGDLDSSVKTYMEALSLIKNGDYLHKADILRSLAFVSIYTDGLDKAYEYAMEALDTLEGKKGKKYYRVRANIYAVLGNILYGNKRYDDALMNYRKGLYWAGKDNFHEREITLNGDIANVYIAQRRYSKAVNVISKNLKLAEKSYRISVPQLYLRRAKVNLYSKEFEKAVKDVQKAVDISEKEGWFRDLGEAYEAMGDILKEKGDSGCKGYYEKAEKIYRDGGYSNLLNRIKERK